MQMGNEKANTIARDSMTAYHTTVPASHWWRSTPDSALPSHVANSVSPKSSSTMDAVKTVCARSSAP